MVPGGAHRNPAARLARLIAAPVLLVPSFPMKPLVPSVRHLWPGVTPCTGIAPGGLAVAQAASIAGTNSRDLRIDRFVRGNPVHHEPAVLDPEREPAFDQIERVLAELLVTPAGQDLEVLAHSGGERLEVVRSGDELRCNTRFLGADLEQKLQEVADQ